MAAMATPETTRVVDSIRCKCFIASIQFHSAIYNFSKFLVWSQRAKLINYYRYWKRMLRWNYLNGIIVSTGTSRLETWKRQVYMVDTFNFITQVLFRLAVREELVLYLKFSYKNHLQLQHVQNHIQNYSPRFVLLLKCHLF